MIKQMQSIGSAILFLLIVTFSVFSQTKSDAFDLSISVDENTFTSQNKAIVKAKIENNTGRTVKLKDLHGAGFNLAKHPIAYGIDDRFGERFIATFPFNNGEIKHRDIFEFKVNLAELSWFDSLSSIYDSTHVNMFEVLSSGNYYLNMNLVFPAKDSTKELPLITTIESNEILVKVQGK